MELDFLIVGQGLAGSLLAWELIQRGCKVLVLDNGLENASQIAAGLMNPITGMRLVKVNDCDLLLPIAKTYYQQLGDFFKQDFHIEKPMLRILNSKKELQQAEKRLNDSRYSDYLHNITDNQEINAPFGILEQKQTAYLLTRPLLLKLRTFFILQHSYQQGQFNYHEIKFEPELSWLEFKPKKIIFAEGHLARYNPWFKHLPFQCVKGEILTLANQTPLPHQILNYGHWLIPLDTHIFRTGATFDPELNTLCTIAGQKTLLHAVQQVLPSTATAKLLKHKANIRPCTLDKQPFIGCHPHYPQLVIFNGFGAKGSLQIPYYSQQLANHLLSLQPLPSVCHIARVVTNLTDF